MSARHRLRTARSTAPVCVLTVLAVGLTGCGLLTPRADAGDVVEARDRLAGSTATVRIPSGSLEVTVGEPVEELDEQDTALLEAHQPPSEGRFVPVSWRLDPITGPFATGDVDAALSLRVDGDAHRVATLDPSDLARSDAYVAVDNAADDVEVAVEFDGLTQTVDPDSGERDAGVAEALYDRAAPRTLPCPPEGWRGAGRFDLRIDCDLTYTTTPWAGARAGWAEPGQPWTLVDAEVHLTGATADDPGADDGARYRVTAITDDSTLGGQSPIRPLVVDPETSRAAGLLVFKTPTGVPGTLELRLSYGLERVYGEDAPQSAGVTVSQRIELPQ